MAVTSIWAVHRSIKDALDYAANPEKAENPNGEDLRRLMDYAENPDKTEQRYLISGVNCLPELAYERMMETKRRYGKYGGIVAYHGYQSFKPGEVTPEQCHALGVELVKRLWGDKYEVLVASHRDHEHLHNHFILNSVSFKDGEKFHCPPYYHDTVMAPESDKLCREHGLSVIQNPQRKRAPYVAYMAEKKGKPSHRTLLKMDIDDAIADCMLPSHLQFALARRGYTFLRGKEYKHPCVIAKGWQRPVRIDNLGERYTPEAIEKRILSRREHRTPYYPSRPPLYEIWDRRKSYNQHNTIELIFMIVLELFGIDTSGKVIQNDNYQEPLSPAMRQEQIYLDRYMETVNLINRNDLGTVDKVQTFIDEKEADMAMLLSARNKIDNRRRRATTEAEKDECSCKRKAISAELKTLRHDINLAKGIFPIIENLKEKLRIEMEQEQEMFPRETGAKIQSKTKRNEEKQK